MPSWPVRRSERVSDEVAIAAARAESERRGHPFLPPVRVSHGLFGLGFRCTVLSHADMRGGNCWVDIDAKTGQVLRYRFISR
jgi:hypothetical protein